MKNLQTVETERNRKPLSNSPYNFCEICSAAMNINPVEQLEKDREDQERKLKKMEKEMEQVFEMKVKEKKKKLKDSEGEVSY